MTITRLVYGDRIAKATHIRTGCSAVIFSDDRARILLTRRSDNGQWCLPGGGMDAGESAAEACIREVLEETGLVVQVTRLIGVYSSPHFVLEYPDGNRWQVVALSFEAEVTGGALQLSDETTDVGYFTPAEIAALDLMAHHRERIADALAGQTAAFMR
jgi:ADP-ribose pyrophosphatase YjhB (NUDIX family)